MHSFSIYLIYIYVKYSRIASGLIFTFYKWNIFFIFGTYSKISKKYPKYFRFGLPTYLEHS